MLHAPHVQSILFCVHFFMQCMFELAYSQGLTLGLGEARLKTTAIKDFGDAWKRCACILAITLCLSVAQDRQAWAVENGNPQWPIGVQTIIPAILPAAGETAYYNYTLYYHADSFKDGNGKDLIPGFESHVLAEAPRIVHTWETKLGPLNMSSGVILVGNFVNVEADPCPASIWRIPPSV